MTAGQFPPDEIWVAAGTYTPDQGINHVPGDATETFTLKSGVQIYGGFIGEESMRSERNPDPNTNNTILSGDLGGGSITLVIAVANGVDAFTVLDGFTLTAAAQHAIETFAEAAPTFRNLLIRDNQSTGSGAAMFNHDNADPSIENCEFRNNTASVFGGAMYNTLDSDPIILDCLFKFNSAGGGGGAIYSTSESYPVIESCDFIANETFNGFHGGAIQQLSFTDLTRRLIVRDCRFENNRAVGPFSLGGAIIINGGQLPAWIVNCVFLANRAEGSRRAIYVDTLIPPPNPVNADIINW